jgi:hypothetical protein
VIGENSPACSAGRRLRPGLKREPTHDRRHHQGEQRDGAVDAAGADAAGDHRGHLAVVVETSEREHHAEQQPDRQQHREVARDPEPDEVEDDLARESALRRPRQDGGQLVGQQDHEQHAGHGQPGDHDFAQQVSGQDPRQKPLLDRPAAGGAVEGREWIE